MFEPKRKLEWVYWNPSFLFCFFLFCFVFFCSWSDLSPKLRSWTRKPCPFNNALPLFYAIFFPASAPTLFLPLLFALWLLWEQQHCTIHLLETWAPAPVERVHPSHPYITQWALMQSHSHTGSSPFSRNAGNFTCCFSFFFLTSDLFSSSEDFCHLTALVHGPLAELSPPCFPRSPVARWLLHFSFLLILSSFPPPSPPLVPLVTAKAARLRIISCAWAERAASPLKPVEISSEGRQVEARGRVSSPLSTHPPRCLTAAAFFFLLPISSIISPLRFWWTGHRSGRKDCSCRWKEGTWCRTRAFRNARSGLKMVSPATPSFAWFIPPYVPANPPPSPPSLPALPSLLPPCPPAPLSPAAPPLLSQSVCCLSSQLEHLCRPPVRVTLVQTWG